MLDLGADMWYSLFYLSDDGFVFVSRRPHREAKRAGIYSSGANTIRRCRKMADARIKVTLRCSECKQRNYNTFKNKKNTPEKLEMSKYCPFCRKHTTHNETK